MLRCLVSQQTLPPHSVLRRHNFALPHRSAPFSQASWLLRVNPRGLISQLGLTSSSLLPCLLFIPPVWLDLPDSLRGSAYPSLTVQCVALQQAHCASRGNFQSSRTFRDEMLSTC